MCIERQCVEYYAIDYITIIVVTMMYLISLFLKKNYEIKNCRWNVMNCDITVIIEQNNININTIIEIIVLCFFS